MNPLGLLLLAACSGADEPLPPPRSGPTHVLRFTSPDGQTWTRDPTPVRDGLVSLGLAVEEDGELRLTGLDHLGKASWWEQHVSGPQVSGMTSFDGATWTEAEWAIDDDEAPAKIDPQWAGEELWYVAFEGSGDPVAAGNQTRIRSSPPARTRAEGEGYADPSPVRFHESELLFVTAHPLQVVQLAGDPLTVVQTWGGVSVPFATVIGEELWLLAQQNVGGHRQPVLARSLDGRHFTPFRPLLGTASVGDCTSPVLGPTPTGLVLLCVEEPRL